MNWHFIQFFAFVKAKDNDKSQPHYGAGITSSLKSNNENFDFNRVAVSLSPFILKANSSVQEAFKKSVLNYDNWEN